MHALLHSEDHATTAQTAIEWLATSGLETWSIRTVLATALHPAWHTIAVCHTDSIVCSEGGLGVNVCVIDSCFVNIRLLSACFATNITL